MAIIYLRAFPWEITQVSASALGSGTVYPLETGLIETHDIYWQTQTLILTGQITVSSGVKSVTVSVGGSSEARAQTPAALRQPTAAIVTATGVDDLQTYEAEATLQFQPSSAGIATDLQRQHLFIQLGGEIRSKQTPDPDFFDVLGFDTIAFDNSTQVGSLAFFGYDIPVYSPPVEGFQMVANFAATRSTFA